MKYTIKVWTHSQDCGDGSSRISLYNTKEELLKEISDYHDEDLSFDDIEKLCDDDPYEYGVISQSSVSIEIVNGVPVLCGYNSFTTD